MTVPEATRLNKTTCLWYDPDSFCSLLFSCESCPENISLGSKDPWGLQKARFVAFLVAGVCPVKSVAACGVV